MAKVSIVGNNFIVTSKFSYENLKFLQECQPDALSLKHEVDGRSVPCFAICVGETPSISNSGISFNAQDHSEEKLATALFRLPSLLDDAKAYVAKTYAPCLVQLDKLEESIETVLRDIEAARDTVANNITVL